ncbi:MAG: hypothetical protein ACK4MF_04735 [Hyphomicrobiaceae bacterium]
MSIATRGITAVVAAILVLALASLQPVHAQDSAAQVKLSDALIKSYLAAQDDLKPLAAKAEAAGDKPDPALEAELEKVAKKHGFASFAELDDVSFTIALIMDGFDAATGAFNEPKEQLQKELAAVNADTTLPASEKKELIAEIEDAIKNTPAVQHKENFAVVKKYIDDIEKATGRD